MSDRANRAAMTVVALVLLAGGGLTACLGAGLFAQHRADPPIVTPTIVHWWREGGWESFAVVGGIGAVFVIAGLVLVAAQLRRNDGRRRTSTIIFDHQRPTPGETSLAAPALSHAIEADLARLPHVTGAAVGLFGPHPDIEMRAVLYVDDNIDLDRLPDGVDDVLSRASRTVGARPHPVQLTVRFVPDRHHRRLPPAAGAAPAGRTARA